MEVLVEYDQGGRFVASCGGYQVTSGTGDDGDAGKDGMWPAQLFVASLGMCIGGYVLSYCRHHDIACEGLRVEMSRETARAPSRTTRVDAKIVLPIRPSPKDAQAILRVADQCHITNSIMPALRVVCSLADGEKEQPAASRADRGQARTTR